MKINLMPETGINILHRKDKENTMKIQQILKLAAIPAIALALTACGGKKAPPAGSNAPAAAASGPIEVTGENYVAEWRTDPNGSIKKYVGQKIKLSGVVDHIMDGSLGEGPDKLGIVFKGKNPANLELGQAVFPKNRMGDVKKLKAGDKFTVSCVGIKNIMLPSCVDAVLEK